ncbi:MAG TPA: Ig-like domain-containing protein, partial [Dehalococcoidia bacterium]|nr:Ig-like domain-containing protein [Dehalococcoidia bacterium]
TIDQPPSHGTLSGTGADRRYTPAAGYTGPDSFRWHANDGLADSAVVSFSLTVRLSEENVPPVAQDQNVSMAKDSTIYIQLVQIDPDGPGPYSVTIVQQPTSGTLTGTDNDRFYTPNPGFFGADSFTWQVNDGLIDSNVATVNITINNPRDAIFLMSLQGRRDSDGGPGWTMPFELTLYSPPGGGRYTQATSYMTNASSSTSKDGTFVLSVNPGTYDIWAKGENTLAVQLTNIDLSVEPLARVQLGLQKGGDLTGDNIVNDADYAPLLRTFGQLTPSLSPGDQLNDHNRDGIVDMSDYAIVVGNFGRSGPTRP